MQRVFLQRAGDSHSISLGAVVATARLIECMQVIGESDDSDGIDTPTPTDNDATDSDGIDTPTPTDNDGTDSDVSR